MFHDVHDEQRVPLRARVDDGGEGHGDRSPQPSGQIRRHILNGQQL
jgi:hypothetical protein